ncbi:MAG: tetratricopeptide repeat protein [Holophagaceae bacterium]
MGKIRRLALQVFGKLVIALSTLVPFRCLFAQDLSAAQVFEKVQGSIVVVKTVGADGKITAQGSGVVLTSGRVISNLHVIQDGSRFLVGTGDQFQPATIYAVDTKRDLCLLKAAGVGWAPATLGRASQLKVGAVVYAIGSPKGLELTISNGIVSQLRGPKPPIIQTTASISPGSSGGGLFNSRGELVGITSWYYEGGQNLNFAAPIEWVSELQSSSVPKAFPRSEMEWHARAAKLTMDGACAELLDWARSWAKAYPNSSAAWKSIGVASGCIKLHANSSKAFAQAAKLDPDDAENWYLLGSSYDQQAKPKEASEAFKMAVQVDPEDGGAWARLAWDYTELGNHAAAIEAHRQAIKSFPEDMDHWDNLGASYAALGRYTEAVETYRQAVRIAPTRARSWYNLGVGLELSKRSNEAITAYREALRNDPGYSSAWDNLAGIYISRGETNAALDAIKQLRRTDAKRAGQLFDKLFPK